jgi:hypothetical protein
MTDYKAQIEEARRAQTAVYLATHEDVAADLSRIIEGLADAVEALVAENDKLRRLSSRWQEIINAPGFAEAVEAEARHYHDSACRYQTERDELVEALAESRANTGDREPRLVEAETVIHEARQWRKVPHMLDHILSEYRPVVLADHDKEVAARTIEGYRDLIERTTKLHDYAMDEGDWDEHKRLVAALTNYAAAIRSGSEGGNR